MALSHEQTTFETTPHCVVLVSGGIDSAACINFLQRQEFTVSGIHVSYGQRAAGHEAVAASAVAEYYGVPLSFCQLKGARRKSAGELIGRNAFLLFTALMELNEQPAILVLGIHSGTPYTDCSPHFVTNVQTLVDAHCDGSVQVLAPFLEWSKKDIWDYCLAHGIPLELTYSCELGLSQPCGACLSCRDLEVLRACQKFHAPA